MTRPHLSLAVLPTLLPALLAACGGPALEAHGLVAPAIGLGARTLVLTDAEGSRAAVGLVMDAAFAQLDADGWFAAEDGSDDMLVMRRGVARLGDSRAQLEPGVAYLRLDVLAADAVLEVRSEEGVDEFGNTIFVETETTSVRVLVNALAARADGTVVSGLEAEGIAEQDGPASELDLIEVAAAEAVRQILAQITPAVTTQRLPFDARDEQQRKIAELAAGGALDDAIAAEARVLSAAPLPAAHYNYGVMLDHRERHDDALASYAAARAGADAELTTLIDAAERGCEQRRVALQALGG